MTSFLPQRGWTGLLAGAALLIVASQEARGQG